MKYYVLKNKINNVIGYGHFDKEIVDDYRIQNHSNSDGTLNEDYEIIKLIPEIGDLKIKLIYSLASNPAMLWNTSCENYDSEDHAKWIISTAEAIIKELARNAS